MLHKQHIERCRAQLRLYTREKEGIMIYLH